MNEPLYIISGPGLKQAIQNASASKKDLEIVYDFDSFGRILRVGYFLIDKSLNTHHNSDIIWFNKNEINITVNIQSKKDFKKAYLDVTYTHNKNNEWHFLLYLPTILKEPLIIRILFRIHKNKVSGFVIQIEVQCKTNDQVTYHPAVRYDCAHGFFHRDMISYDGLKDKIHLEALNTKDAIIYTFNELYNNLNSWLNMLGYITLAPDVLEQPIVLTELNRARDILIELHDNPQKIYSTKSKFIQIKNGLDKCIQIWPPLFESGDARKDL